VKLLSDYHNPPMLQTDGQTIHSIAIPRYAGSLRASRGKKDG